MLIQPVNQAVCKKALVIVMGSLAVAGIAAQLIEPAAQPVPSPAAAEEITRVIYSIDYVPTCSAPVNLMRPPGVDHCTGQARKPGDIETLQSSIPLTFRK